MTGGQERRHALSPLRVLLRRRSALMLPILLMVAGPSSSCDIREAPSTKRERHREQWCNERLVAREVTRLLKASGVSPGICEYTLRSTIDDVDGCLPGNDPYCGRPTDRTFQAYAFTDVCDWGEPDRVFEVGSGVEPAIFPRFIAALLAARNFAEHWRGLGWTAPMQVLAAANLTDVMRVERLQNRWNVRLRVCREVASRSDCSEVEAEFNDAPASLEDVRVFWID